MTDKLATLGPEVAMLIGATLCLVWGLAESISFRRMTVVVAAVTLLVAGWLACPGPASGEHGAVMWGMGSYVKMWVAGIGLLLLFVAKDVPTKLKMTRDSESGHQLFDAANVMRGEFFAFFLLSLTGVMLTAGADDLVWLFLALELTSLPTYVIVATSRDRITAQESGVKYFFLGAMAAAVFLYGFAMIYGATGHTEFEEIRKFVIANGYATSPLLVLGIALSVVGIAFKIAAFPMHFYAGDVYQGATTPVTAFLAFVPKTAGFVSLILLLGLVRGDDGTLPLTVGWLISLMAIATMTLGNALGLLQTSVKRVLAYSSIAHSGYMLVGLLGSSVGGVAGSETNILGLSNGVSGVLFYLVAYGLGNLGAFTVLSMLERDGEEAESFDDLAGLARRRPWLAAVMLVSVLSLIGLPPAVGFVGKIYLFAPAVMHGYQLVVVIAVLNSAVSAVYYLRIIGACFFAKEDRRTRSIEAPLRQWTAIGAAALVLFLGLPGLSGGQRLAKSSAQASKDIADLGRGGVAVPQAAEAPASVAPQVDVPDEPLSLAP